MMEHAFYTRSFLTRLLVEIGYERKDVDTWFGEAEEDKQNVTAPLHISCKQLRRDQGE